VSDSSQLLRQFNKSYSTRTEEGLTFDVLKLSGKCMMLVWLLVSRSAFAIQANLKFDEIDLTHGCKLVIRPHL
jgi:hypothetical protein